MTGAESLGRRRALHVLALTPLLSTGLASVSERAEAESRKFEERLRRPATQCLGTHRNGRLLHPRRLESRPWLHIKRGSEDRTWGHPWLIQMINSGAHAVAREVPGSVALVGDLSAFGGGPLSGHRSHQNGLDADVGLFAMDGEGRPVVLRRFERFDGQGRSLDTPGLFLDLRRNWLMLRAWLTDLRVVVERVFVSGEIRALMLEYGRRTGAPSMRLPPVAQALSPDRRHDDHLHLRVGRVGD